MNLYSLAVLVVKIPLLLMACLLLVLSLVFCLEIFVGSLGYSSSQTQRLKGLSIDLQKDDVSTPPPTIAILIPAHNEALLIESTLTALLQEIEHDRVPMNTHIFVIADNCTDATATLARQVESQEKITVLERQDLHRRGKGYALDYGLQVLAENPPEVVIIIDADCQAYPQTIGNLAQLALITGRPIQALYLLEKPPQPSLKDLISAFAFKVKNSLRPRSLVQLKIACPLAGTGMAFPWSVLQSTSLASSHIVEDMKLGLDLAIAGHPPLFCPQAQVIGCLPGDEKASTGQRTRWEHGHLQLLLTYVPLLFKIALKKGRFDLIPVAFDLAIPPLSSLVIVWILVTGLSTIATWVLSFWTATILLGVAGVLMGLAIGLAWYQVGRTELPFHKLLAIPLYILWKIPLYFKFLVKPQTQWVRTERDKTHSSQPPL
jgi:cellulose synthase/poly-beta-1,6-N-acetylglucosamine synthase-like glycosyltransferase